MKVVNSSANRRIQRKIVLAQIFLWVQLLGERHFMSNPPAVAGFEARSARLRMARLNCY